MQLPWLQFPEADHRDGCVHHAVDDCCPAGGSTSQLCASVQRAAQQSARSPVTTQSTPLSVYLILSLTTYNNYNHISIPCNNTHVPPA